MLNRRRLALSAGTPQEPNEVYLYNAGDECVDITGGWVNKGYIINPANTTISKEADHLYLSANTGIGANTFATAKTIDTSPYSKMVIDATCQVTGVNAMAVMYFARKLATATNGTSAFGSFIETFSAQAGATTSGPFTIDLTKLAYGSIDPTAHHIALTAGCWGNTSKFTVRSIKLVK